MRWWWRPNRCPTRRRRTRRSHPGRDPGSGAFGRRCSSRRPRRHLRRQRPVGKQGRPRPVRGRRAQKSGVRRRRPPAGFARRRVTGWRGPRPRRRRGKPRRRRLLLSCRRPGPSGASERPARDGRGGKPPGGRPALRRPREPGRNRRLRSRTSPTPRTPGCRRRGVVTAPTDRRPTQPSPSGRRRCHRYRRRRRCRSRNQTQKTKDWLMMRGGADSGRPANRDVDACGRRHRPRRPRSGPALPRPAPAALGQPAPRRPGGPPERSRRTWDLPSCTRAGPARRRPRADAASWLLSAGRRVEWGAQAAPGTIWQNFGT